jgi:hypothetical protein
MLSSWRRDGPYKCACGYAFPTVVLLRDHVKTHLNVK